jgi:hypothetical protein
MPKQEFLDTPHIKGTSLFLPLKLEVISDGLKEQSDLPDIQVSYRRPEPSEGTVSGNSVKTSRRGEDGAGKRERKRDRDPESEMRDRGGREGEKR